MIRAARLCVALVVAAAAAGCGSKSPNNPTAHVRSITLNPTTVQLQIGQSQTITATVTADAGADQALTWSSNAALVAAVDQSGKVTGQGGGTARVTATSKADPSISASATVNVAVAIGAASR